MLRVNVGLSRKLTKDYNSTGYSVNVDGEVTASTSDGEAVMEQVKELFDLAEEALDLQIERTQGNNSIANRDEEQEPPAGRAETPKIRPSSSKSESQNNGNGNGHQDEQPATDKQIAFLLNLAKRHELSTAQLERKIADVLGRSVGLYDLTKKSAGLVLNAFTNQAASNRPASRR